MKRNLAITIVLVIAAIHFAATLDVVPEGNRLFQQRYDTGYQPTISETNIMRLTYVLAFPLMFWVWIFHPSRINLFIWYSSAIANALLWGAFIVWASGFLRRHLGSADR
jgi:hypothetical protein